MTGTMAQRFADTEVLINRRGSLVSPCFDPDANAVGDVTDFIASSPVLCVGAGGLGCEVLKDLALTGFKNVHVIDMDTIDVTNLNRQFLFRRADVGKTKAEVAAERIMERVNGCTVTPHVGRIEEKPDDFYEQFAIIILGLDSLEARRYMNRIVCSFLEFQPDGAVKPETLKPMVDGGTEGFKGHARVILPGVTPCFDCTLWLFPPQVTFPLCTLAETPRSPVHCIEYAHLILWEKQRPDERFDADNEEHMQWMFDRATERAAEFDIQGVTLQLTQGVVKNIIPAIPSTNAIVAAACVLEAFKLLSNCYPHMDNYMMYSGTDGVYTHTVKYERDAGDPACGAGVALHINPDMTLQQLIDALLTGETLGALKAPSVSVAGHILYMRGPLEASYRPNLAKPLAELLERMPDEEECVMVIVTDPALPAPVKVRLVAGDVTMAGSA